MPQDTPTGLLDRVPPHNLQAERCAIGSLMQEGGDIASAPALLRPEDFYRHSHQVLYRAVLEVADKRGGAIDPVLIRDHLESKKLFEAAGGNEGLVEVLESVPSAAHFEHYAKIVRGKSLLRRLIAACAQGVRDAYECQEDEQDVATQVERRLTEAIESGAIDKPARMLDEIMDEAYEHALKAEQDEVIGTGLTALDNILGGGFLPGEYVLIGGRPSMGKTALGMGAAAHIATTLKLPAVFFSMEMRDRELAGRLLFGRAGVSRPKSLHREFSAIESGKLAHAVSELRGSPLRIDETPGLSVGRLRALARRYKRDGIRAVFIDYIGLMDGGGGENRNQEVTAISRGLKSLARELNVPVVAVSQLNRAPAGRQGHKPQLSDLRESGSLEQDADTVLFVHREEYYNPTDDNKGRAEIIVAKQRNGATATAAVLWDAERTRFYNEQDRHRLSDAAVLASSSDL